SSSGSMAGASRRSAIPTAGGSGGDPDEPLMDWGRWHEEYDDPDSRLSRRLEVVSARLAEAIAACPGRLRLLSLCAGEARDVISVLSEHPRSRDVDATVVE